jgi:cbb3-type cytochrome oxidase cytochrome c subunit
LQLWRRNESGEFNQVYAGDGPVYSPTLEAYFIAVNEGQKLRISSDEAGLQWWPTSEEVRAESEAIERAEKQVERAAKEAERAAKEAAQKGEKEALARVAELEALLARTMQKKK